MDILRDTRRFSGLPGRVESQPGSRDRDILKNASHQKLAVLHHNADVPAERSQVKAVYILSVVENSAFSRLFKSKENPDQRRLAAARLSHDGHILAGLDPDAHIVQDVRHRIGIAEAYMAHLNISAQSGHGLLADRHLRFLLENRHDHLKCGADSRDHQGDRGDLHKRAGDVTEGSCESHVIVISNAAADGCAVHDHGADQSDSRADHRIHLDDHGRVIEKLRLFGVQFSPAGKRALFCACQLDLLNAGDHCVVHTVFLRRQLHGGSGDLRVEER